MRRIVQHFLAVVALAAAGMYLVGCKAGVGEPATAEATVAQERTADLAPQDVGEQTDGESDVEPLALTLGAPTTCRVEEPNRDVHGIVGRRDDGTSEEVYESGDWFGVATVLVSWEVYGGTPPYTLVIDEESRDVYGEYGGSAGSALVSCALENGETYFVDRFGSAQRWHRAEPTVDSGLKTIHATVTDEAGATASASIEVYAVRTFNSGGWKLEAGKTYRLWGRHLVTIPDGVDMKAGGLEESDCVGEDCESSFEVYAVDDGHLVGVGIGLRSGAERGRFHLFDGAWLSEDDPRNRGGSSEHPLHAKLDELIESIGQPPNVDRP